MALGSVPKGVEDFRGIRYSSVDSSVYPPDRPLRHSSRIFEAVDRWRFSGKRLVVNRRRNLNSCMDGVVIPVHFEYPRGSIYNRLYCMSKP